MASYFLLTWNPRRGEDEWPDVDRCLSDSRDGRPVTLTWRCQNKSPLAGDRVFMLRQGVEPRGIMGSGDVLTTPYRSERAAPRILHVRMDVLLDPILEGVLPISQLRQGELAEVHWNTQASGIAIPERAIPELLALWQAFLRRGHRSSAKWYSTEQYASALRQLESVLNQPLREMLKAHVAAPGQCLSVNELAAAAAYESPQIVYAQYGRLGKALGALLKHDLHNETVFTRVFAHDHRAESGELYWTLDPAMTRALERQDLGGARNADGTERMGSSDGSLTTSLPEEIAEPDDLFEGAKQTVVVNRYERSSTAKQRCIEYYGARCTVCDLEFEDRYGPQMAGFIHVHHLTPLSTIGEAYRIDPIKDLRPICPNCHAVVHSRTPAMTIEEAKDMILAVTGH